jgi:hypothetical protein
MASNCYDKNGTDFGGFDRGDRKLDDSKAKV